MTTFLLSSTKSHLQLESRWISTASRTVQPASLYKPGFSFLLMITTHSILKVTSQTTLVSISQRLEPHAPRLRVRAGHTVVDRLIHIVLSCPSLAPEAFQLCVQYIHQSRDPSLYQSLLQAYDQVASCPDVSLPNPMNLAELDTKWADEVLTKNQADRVKLEVELKTYSNNMIKESIRVSPFSCKKKNPLRTMDRWHIATWPNFIEQLVIMAPH